MCTKQANPKLMKDNEPILSKNRARFYRRAACSLPYIVKKLFPEVQVTVTSICTHMGRDHVKPICRFDSC